MYLVSHMGRKRNQVQRVDKITQLQDVAETRIPLSKHTMMPNPFPEMSEVNGGQKVPEPRSDLSKNTSLVGGEGGRLKQRRRLGKLSGRHIRTF